MEINEAASFLKMNENADGSRQEHTRFERYDFPRTSEDIYFCEKIVRGYQLCFAKSKTFQI